jgi:beta-lactamase class A
VIPISCTVDVPPALVAARGGALRPPAIVAPAPRQVSFGHVYGSVSQGTSRVLVKVNGVLQGSRAPRRGRYHFTLDLPARHVTIRVVAQDAAGNRRFRIVRNVFGLPRAGSPKPPRPSAEDGRLAQLVRQLARGYGGTAGVYVQNMQTRRGAAWNARARFPAASTIKLAIAVEVLRTLGAVPQPGSRLYGLLRRMLVYSENEAANSLLMWLGGSKSGGSDRVNAMLRSLGIRETTMYGGYEVSTAAARPIPLRVEEQPAFGIGKHTTAYDLAKLHGAVFSAAGSRGGLLRLRGSFTPADARFLLWILAHVDDRGKLGRFLPPTVPVLHKAGWITNARHDAGIVFWRGGSYVVAVMTWRGPGVGSASDVLAGRVAVGALRRFQALRKAESATTATTAGSATLASLG